MKQNALELKREFAKSTVSRSQLRMTHNSQVFSVFSTAVARATGRPATFVLCVATILGWAILGPVFHFSDTWQLVINTGTTIITFLQVFLIQNTQNRDSAAIQAKLDELIRASAAHNRFIGIEGLTEEELEQLRARDEGDRVTRIERAREAADEAVTEVGELADRAARKAKPRIK